ncbi:hypothetical protein Acsp04_48580 [Actinomadura sp. NBRC 104425]|uniref:hypothetical protein n=1 Tax=Actinomadura sp. NBRC 104425 TaxID=3032204 RepID=UPI0024A42DAF|nr:hypothetical protein [Actinomadura sp. NBRC 104425]GLZ14623.1 hypothetical protein Acsp04_48580 [Actinomadura sp. NBRC 104425]
MTDSARGSATTRLIQADRVYVGWRYAQVHPDPGPPPEPPEPAGLEPPPAVPVPRPVEHMAGRPLRMAAGATGVGVALFVGCGLAGVLPWAFAGVALLACAIILGITGSALWREERVIRARLAAERDRLERLRAERRRREEAAAREHEAAYRDWERRRRAYDSQREWYPVAVPPGVDRVDIVGGTLAGWSAAVTTMGASRLAVGARVTVIDLSEGAVAHDLLRLAADRGDDPLVWVLPADLPRLDATRGLGREALADVLSLVVGAGDEHGSTRDLSFDNSILERVIDVLRPAGRRSTAEPTIPQITAALRVLAQVGDPRDDLRRGLLTDDQLERLATMFGRDATDRIVVRRAWALEAQLRKLEKLATEPVRLPPSRLHVLSMDRRAGVLTNRILGTYVTTALTHRIRQSPPGGRWDHTLFLCGAEKLRGDVLDRLIDACEAAGTGLVLMYRSIPPHVRERLGRRGHAAVGFMRVGNPEDARVAADHIGAGQRLLVAEMTDSAGEALPDDVAAEGYASTVAYARVRGDGLTDPVWSPLPGPADDAALARVIGSATAWGRTVGADGAGKQRSRELLVEPHQLQELPPTAMVFTHAGGSGRRILLVDANPGIITLPTTHSMQFEEYLREQEKQDGQVGLERDSGDAPPPDGSSDAQAPEAPNGSHGRSSAAPPAAPHDAAPGSGATDHATNRNAHGEADRDTGRSANRDTGRSVNSGANGSAGRGANSGTNGEVNGAVRRGRHGGARRGTRIVPSLRSSGRHAADPPQGR